MQKRCNLQTVQWAMVDGICKEIAKLTELSQAVSGKADKQLADTIEGRLRPLKAKRDELLAEIEQDRQRLARMLISTLLCADFTATIFDRFGDECKRVTHNSTQKNAYVELGKDAINETYQATKLVTDKVMDKWNDVVTAIDSVQDDTVSHTFLKLSEQFQARMLQLVEEFEKEIKNSYTAYF